MKKSWKIFWITCGVVMFIGVVCMGAGMAMGASYEAFYHRFPYGIGLVNTSGTDIRSGMLQADMQETFEDIDEIDMDVSIVSVQILKSNEKKGPIRLETTDMDARLNFRYEVEGNTLQIKTDHQERVWKLRNVINRGTVYLYVPEEMLEEVSLELKAGEIYVEQIQAKHLSVHAGIGEVTIDDFTADIVEFDCGMGEMTVGGTPVQEVDIKTGLGSIEFLVNGAEQDYNYSVECDIGEVSIGATSFDGFNSNKEMDNGTDKSINIECGVGDVSVSFTK